MSDKPAEQADHARGAGRDALVKEFESFAPWIIQHADICPGEDLCECGKRERVQKWREALQKLREPGADTGTTATGEPEPLSTDFAEFVAMCQRHKARMSDGMSFIGSLAHWFNELAAAERGTTPPEGLRELEDALDARDVLSSLLTSFLVRLNCADKVRDLTEAEYEIREKVRDALNGAATQRAPVEQGRLCEQVQALRPVTDMYDGDGDQRIRHEGYERAKEDVLKLLAAAPDHAREGAVLREAKWWYKEFVWPWRADDEDSDDRARKRLAALANGKKGGE